MKRVIFFLICVFSLALYWQLLSKMDYDNVLHPTSAQVLQEKSITPILAEKSQ